MKLLEYYIIEIEIHSILIGSNNYLGTLYMVTSIVILTQHMTYIIYSISILKSFKVHYFMTYIKCVTYVQTNFLNDTGATSEIEKKKLFTIFLYNIIFKIIYNIYV